MKSQFREKNKHFPLKNFSLLLFPEMWLRVYVSYNTLLSALTSVSSEVAYGKLKTKKTKTQ